MVEKNKEHGFVPGADGRADEITPAVNCFSLLSLLAAVPFDCGIFGGPLVRLVGPKLFAACVVSVCHPLRLPFVLMPESHLNFEKEI